MRAGNKTVPVKIVNASATGFLLECPKVDAVAGDLLTLATSAGLCEIRVAFAETTSDHTRLGVQRVRELDDLSHAGTSVPWYSFIPGCDRAAGGPGNLAIAIVALAVLVAGGAYLVRHWPGSSSLRLRPSTAGQWLSRKMSETDRQVQQAISQAGAWLRGHSPSAQPPERPVANWRPVSDSRPAPPPRAYPQVPSPPTSENRTPKILTPEQKQKRDISPGE